MRLDDIFTRNARSWHGRTSEHAGTGNASAWHQASAALAAARETTFFDSLQSALVD